eukprot:1128628-Prymnesium_polylepis.1
MSPRGAVRRCARSRSARQPAWLLTSVTTSSYRLKCTAGKLHRYARRGCFGENRKPAGPGG